MKRWLICALFVAAINGALAVHRFSPPLAAESKRDLHASDGALRTASSTRSTDFARDPPRTTPAVPAPPNGSTLKRASAPPAPAPAPEREVESTQDHLEAAFLREASDEGWTAEVRRAFESKPIMPAGSRLLAIECHSTLCKVESAHDDVQAYDDFVLKAFRDPETRLWNAGASIRPTTELDSLGGRRVVAFIAREGGFLPKSL